MNVHELRRCQMLQRVRLFADTCHGAFADVPLAAQMVAVIDASVDAVEREATRHCGAVRHARERTVANADARAAVLQQQKCARYQGSDGRPPPVEGGQDAEHDPRDEATQVAHGWFS